MAPRRPALIPRERMESPLFARMQARPACPPGWARHAKRLHALRWSGSQGMNCGAGAPRWLVGADAHMQWRRLLERAVEAGELVLLHFGSKLPVEARTEPQAAPVVADSASDAPACDFSMLATRDQLIEAFGRFTNMDASWFNNLKDNRWRHIGPAFSPGTQPEPSYPAC